MAGTEFGLIALAITTVTIIVIVIIVSCSLTYHVVDLHGAHGF